MAINNTYGNMLQQPPQRAYTRMPGTASGLGQKQPITCPTGYRYDTTQGRCVAVNNPKPGFWQQVGQGVSSAGGQMTAPQPATATTAPKAPTIATQPVLKPNQYSPYAQLVAQAIDLNPPLMGGQQPYYQVQPIQQAAPVGKQLAINQDFLNLVGR